MFANNAKALILHFFLAFSGAKRAEIKKNGTDKLLTYITLFYEQINTRINCIVLRAVNN